MAEEILKKEHFAEVKKRLVYVVVVYIASSQ